MSKFKTDLSILTIFRRDVLPSASLSLSKPISWLTVFMGSLAIFNSMKLYFNLDTFSLIEIADGFYSISRDFILDPIGWSIGLSLSPLVKNMFVVYFTIGRSFNLAFNVISENLKVTNRRQGLDITVNQYPPFENSLLKNFVSWRNWVRKKSPRKFEKLFGIIGGFLSSLLWPISILTLLKNPTIIETTHFDSDASTITSDGKMWDKESKNSFEEKNAAQIFSGNIEPEDFPPEPESRERSLYNARVFFASFILAQIALTFVLFFLNYIGLILSP